jgi:drug/metabolite transporter (DMT)-like permease
MRSGSVDALAGEPIAVGSWIFLSLGATVLAFYLWNVPLRVITPTALAVFVYLIPVVAVTTSILFWRGPDGQPLQEFNWWLVLGGATVLAGVALANEAFWRRRAERAPKSN